MLTHSFFNRDAAKVAQALLGKVIRVKQAGIWLSARIIETEAYYIHEKASHASLGFTPKRKALFMPAGTIYMYHSRAGDSLNISCRGDGNAVLLKSAIPYLDQLSPKTMLQVMQRLNPLKNGGLRDEKYLCAGQALLCRALGLKIKKWDQQQFNVEEFYFDDVGLKPTQIIQTTRLGIALKRDAHLMLRFIDFDFAKYCSSNPLIKRKNKVGKDFFINR